MTLTTFLAAYGALLSSAGLGWNFYRDFHDRAKLKTKLSLKTLVTNKAGRSFVVRPDLGEEGSAVFGYMDLTNVGKRPIYVEGVAGKWKIPVNGKSGFIVVPEGHLPKQLGEGESTYQIIPELDTFTKNLRNLYAYDSTGKNWKVSRKDLRAIVSEVQRLSDGLH